MKKRIVLFLLLLFALFAVIFVVPTLMKRYPPVETPESSRESAGTEATETMETTMEPPSSEPSGPEPSEPETPPEEGPGEPVRREKVVTDLMFASDIHYMSQSLTDYGKAFEELIDNGDGKVVRYMPQIWQAFAEEVIATRPDAVILSGDLTMNGEKVNHQELAERLSAIESEGIPVLVIPGNHDINNRYATSYFGDSQTFIENTSPEEFREIYRAFGYDEAASHAPDSLSYLYILNETTWLMMLDSNIYDPENAVDGEIRPGTLEWMKERLKDAYSQGITVIPVAHHNLQELSRVYVEECVIRNNREVMELLETYLTPVYFSGHLHVQRVAKHTKEPGVPADTYGLWEIVSTSLIIPPCQYGKATLNADGSVSYHAASVDVSGWAAKHGDATAELLDFPAYSDRYLHSVVSRQIYKSIEDVPDYIREAMADFYAGLYRDYYAGKQVNYSEKKKDPAYQWWDRLMYSTSLFRQVDGMMRDGMAVNSNAEIPNPIDQNRE